MFFCFVLFVWGVWGGVVVTISSVLGWLVFLVFYIVETHKTPKNAKKGAGCRGRRHIWQHIYIYIYIYIWLAHTLVCAQKNRKILPGLQKYAFLGKNAKIEFYPLFVPSGIVRPKNVNKTPILSIFYKKRPKPAFYADYIHINVVGTARWMSRRQKH